MFGAIRRPKVSAAGLVKLPRFSADRELPREVVNHLMPDAQRWRNLRALRAKLGNKRMTR